MILARNWPKIAKASWRSPFKWVAISAFRPEYFHYQTKTECDCRINKFSDRGGIHLISLVLLQPFVLIAALITYTLYTFYIELDKLKHCTFSLDLTREFDEMMQWSSCKVLITHTNYHSKDFNNIRLNKFSVDNRYRDKICTKFIQWYWYLIKLRHGYIIIMYKTSRFHLAFKLWVQLHTEDAKTCLIITLVTQLTCVS